MLLIFHLAVNNGSGSATAMYIKSDGNVGIGTTSPDSSLHIEGSDNSTSQLHLKNTSFSSDPADFFITPVYSSNQLQIRNSSKTMLAHKW